MLIRIANTQDDSTNVGGADNVDLVLQDDVRIFFASTCDISKRFVSPNPLIKSS